MKKILQIAALSVLVANAYAETPASNLATPPSDVEQPQLQETPVPGIQDSYEYVEKMAMSYKSKIDAALRKAGKTHTITLGLSIQDVEKTTSSQSWGASRAVAYAKAMSEVRANYVSSINASIKTETLNSLFQTDDSPEITIEDLKKSSNSYDSMLNKAVALANGKLDEALKNMDIDAGKYNAAPIEKRKLMMRNSIETKTKVTAYGDLSGMTVKRTFEATDVHGNTTVAVLTIVSPKMKDRVQSLLNSKGNILADPAKVAKGIDINKWVTENEDKLIFEQGIKLMYDTKGMPMLVSFGQSPIKGSGTKKELRKKAKFAKPLASNRAFANFAELYNMNGKFKNLTKSGVVTSQYESIKMNDDGSTDSEEKTAEKTINEINQTMNTAANINNVAGIKTIHTWMMVHPSNPKQMIVGEVKVWTPESDKAARQIRAGKTPTKAIDNSKATEANSGAFESSLDSDMDDF